MVRLRDESNTVTIFQFDDTEKVVAFEGTFSKTIEVTVRIKKRHLLKDVIKPGVKNGSGFKNKKTTITVGFFGSSRITNIALLETALLNNSFFFMDSEGLRTDLDGVYALRTQISGKDDPQFLEYIGGFDIIEKE